MSRHVTRSTQASRSVGLSEAQRTQNSLTVPHSRNLDLIPLVLQDYFQYSYVNEALAPLFRRLPAISWQQK